MTILRKLQIFVSFLQVSNGQQVVSMQGTEQIFRIFFLVELN